MVSELEQVVSLLSGANLASGNGSLATANIAYFERLVIDHEIHQMVRPSLGGIGVNETTLEFDVIRRVGLGGNFQTDPQSPEWMRRGDHYFSQVTTHVGRWAAACWRMRTTWLHGRSASTGPTCPKKSRSRSTSRLGSARIEFSDFYRGAHL